MAKAKKTVVKDPYEPEPDNTLIDEITNMVLEVIALREKIEQHQQTAKELAAEERALAQQTLPEKMREARLTSFTTEDGIKVKFEHKVRASLSAARKEEGFAWLREKGFGDLIKPRVVEETVHAQTLAAFIREQIGRGVAIPTTLFGVFEYDETIIK